MVKDENEDKFELACLSNHACLMFHLWRFVSSDSCHIWASCTEKPMRVKPLFLATFAAVPSVPGHLRYRGI